MKDKIAEWNDKIMSQLEKIKKSKYFQPEKIILWCVIIALLISWAQFWYQAYTYNKIPQVFKNDLKVFDTEPRSIFYLNSELLNQRQNQKLFLYNLATKPDIFSISWDIHPMALYQSSDYDLRLYTPDWMMREQMQLDLLKRGVDAFSEQVWNRVITRLSNYDWTVSPYKIKEFKLLNSNVSNLTYIAALAKNEAISLLDTFFSEYFYGDTKNWNSPIWILAWVFSSFNRDIDTILAYININTTKSTGELILDIKMYWDREPNREADIVCNTLHKNFLWLYENDKFLFRSPRCESIVKKWSMKIVFSFTWVDLQMRKNHSLINQ